MCSRCRQVFPLRALGAPPVVHRMLANDYLQHVVPVQGANRRVLQHVEAGHLCKDLGPDTGWHSLHADLQERHPGQVIEM